MLLRIRLIAAFFLSVAASPALVQASELSGPGEFDWPSQRGDLGRRGRSVEQLAAAKLKPMWTWASRQAPTPAWPGPARWDAFAGLAGLKAMRNYDPVFHVTAVGDAVFFGSSSDDAVRCVDAQTGALRWLYRSSGPVRVAPTIAGEFVFFGSDDGHAYCLRRDTGELVWKFEVKPGGRRILNNGRLISAFPVRTGVHVLDGVAYFGASLLPWRSSFICAMNAANGTLVRGKAGHALYVRDLGTGWSLEGALLLSPQSLIVPQGRVAPLTFERTTGNPQGTLEGGGGSFCLLTDDDQVLHGPGNKDGWITASTADSREKLASYARGNAIVVRGKTAYMLSDLRLAAMDREKQLLLWSRPTKTPFELILAGETLYCGGDGIVEARNAVDGALLWRAEVPGRAWGLAVAHGRLLVSTDMGQVLAFEASGEAQAAPGELLEQAGLAELNLAPPLLERRSEGGLLDRWVFQSDQLFESTLEKDDPRTAPALQNLGDGPALMPVDRDRLVQAGDLHALVLDGKSGDIEVSADIDALDRPVKAISAEAWVRIDRGQTWGGLMGMAQDNGSYERGWMLGFRERRFGFALATEKGSGRLTWLLAPEDFVVGTWHQVLGTYDGKRMRLYVDGEQVAESNAESGKIHYPEHAYYHLGAYRDDDEYFRVKGLLGELALYDRALSPRDVKRHWSAGAERLPRPVAIESRAKPGAPEIPGVALPMGLSLRFVAAGEAVVRWETDEPASSRLRVQPENGVAFIVEREGLRRSHKLELSGLRDATLYTCNVLFGSGQTIQRSLPFECDTHFDFYRGQSQGRWALEGEDPRAKALIDLWRSGSPVQEGLAVVLGASGGEQEARWLAQLARGMRGLILVTGDPPSDGLRAALAELGPYGARLSCITVPERGELQLPRQFANIVIGNPHAPGESRDLLARGAEDLVRSDGGLLLLATEETTRDLPSFEPWVSNGVEHQTWFSARKRAEVGAADWSHMYGRPDNSAYAGEELSGASSTAELELAWIGKPGPRYQTDRQNRKPAPLSTAGRLFLQGLNRVLAVDGHNGTLLWDIGLPNFQRFNIPRSSSNWCADRAALYLAMGKRLHLIEAASGDASRTIEVHVPDELREANPGIHWEWGYVAQQGALAYGSAVRAGGQYTEWWGGSNWFDAKEGENAKKVCNEALFAVSKEDGRLQWSRSEGLVVEPTIAISAGRIVFAECRAKAARALNSARIGPELWSDLWLVCLDASTGELLWEREAKPLTGSSALFVSIGEGTIVMVTSGLHEVRGAEARVGEYAIYAFDLEDGRSIWRKKIAWEADHHGKHLSHPAIVEGQLILRPITLDLATGKQVRDAFPGGHQCGSYACSKGAIFLRAGDMSVWDRETGESTSWARLRPDCWISTIPAAGMLLSPEGGGGCSCGSWIQASMGFVPRVER